MEKQKEQIVNRLNQLLTRNYDAEAGYKDAAKNVEDPKLRAFFETAAQQRYDFGHKIKGEIRELGGTPYKGTSMTADIHRTWIDLKSNVAKRTRVAVLEECIRGEETAIRDYQDVLSSSEIKGEYASMLQNQLAEIKDKVEHINEFKEQLELVH